VSQAPTPFAEAVALLAEGVAPAQVEAALRARGLDAQAVRLVMEAAQGLSGRERAAQEWVWTETAEPGPEPVPAAAPGPAGTEPTPLGACARCGVFITTGAHAVVLGKSYCLACGARPDVNAVRAWRDACWGRRDAWAWVMGGFAVLELLSALILVQRGAVGAVLFMLFGFCVHLLFFAGVPVARALLVLLVIAVGAVSLVNASVVQALFPAALAWAALTNTRSRLFFKLEPSEDELLAAWVAARSNRVARWSLGVAALAAGAAVAAWAGAVPAWVALLLGGAAAVLGAVAASRVDLAATPPIGERGSAWTGLLLGTVAAASALWLLLASSRIYKW
jgi:hypothetical protein